MATERELLEEATAEAIVDEALARYERTIPPGRLAPRRIALVAPPVVRLG